MTHQHIDVFEKREWTKGTDPTQRIEPEIALYTTHGSREMKSRLIIISNIPIIDSDPRESHSYSHHWVLPNLAVASRESLDEEDA